MSERSEAVQVIREQSQLFQGRDLECQYRVLGDG